jgi:UDP-N-acetyl-D-mannosaminuronate dehydrogenase
VRDELARRGAQPLAADPLYDDDELRALGFTPWDGAEVAGVILQADHATYASLGPEDLPGARVVVDGRRVLDPERFAVAGVRLLGIGHR